MTPLVSIVTPVYKAERLLPKCIDSIISQTYDNWELILVDDGSPDGSGQLCDEYASRDSRIRVLHKENGGVSSARNAGFDMVNGEYVWFIDSDDWIDSNAINNLIGENGIHGCDICFFCMDSYPNKVSFFSFDGILGNLSQKIFSGKNACGDAIASIELESGFGWAWNKLFVTKIIRDNRLRFDERFSLQEDHLFTFSYMRFVSSISVLSYAPYHYYIQDNSLRTSHYPFYSTKERNMAMLAARKSCCELFNINNQFYNKWFVTDYISREIRNLRNMKGDIIDRSTQFVEINKCINLVRCNRDLKSRDINRLRLVSFLPLSIIAKLLS